MAYRFVDRAKMSVSGTPGTGTITLGSAVTAYQAFGAAGLGDGDTCRYLIIDGSNWELGVGTYTVSGTTLARTTVTASNNSGSKITATSGAVVSVTFAADDIVSTDGWMPLSFGTTGTVFGISGLFISDQSFALAAGEMLEIEGYVHKASSANGLLAVSGDNGTTAYVVFVGNDGNYATNYITGGTSFSDIISTGGVSAQNWTGVHKLKPTIVAIGSDNNSIFTTFDGFNQIVKNDTHVQMVGTLVVYMQTDDITQCSVRARVVSGGMFG